MKQTVAVWAAGMAAAFGGMGLTANGARAAEAVVAPQGEYLEARSLSVYAGACHYNGELTTAGREAVIAWNFTQGQVDGVPLAGVRAFALVAGSDNLGFRETTRHAVLYVDAAATTAQRDAVVKLLKLRVGATLGDVVAVKSAPVSFQEKDDRVILKATGVTQIEATRYPCAHCRMPAQTWYEPLTPTKSEVANGLSTGFSDKTLGVSWSQTESDNVYVGTFQM